MKIVQKHHGDVSIEDFERELRALDCEMQTEVEAMKRTIGKVLAARVAELAKEYCDHINSTEAA